MQIQGETSVNKLIVLFVFDKMESALSQRTIIEMCTAGNNWLNYMDLSSFSPVFWTTVSFVAFLPLMKNLFTRLRATAGKV